MNNELWTWAVTLRASCVLIIEWSVNYLIICISLLKSEKPSACGDGWPWQVKQGWEWLGLPWKSTLDGFGERAGNFIIRWGLICKPGTAQEWHQCPGRLCPQGMDAWMLVWSVACGERHSCRVWGCGLMASWRTLLRCGSLWICNCFPFGFRFKLFC